MWRRAGLLLSVAALLLAPTAVSAEEPKNRGLFITPLRSYLSVSPGSASHNTFTVANITNQPTTVNLSIEQFSVNDYAYDYQFRQVHEDWVRLGKTQVTLQPNKSETIRYTVAAPPSATPGGHYFTLFATAQLQNNPNKVRAATVLYVTVHGDLTKTSEIGATAIPAVSFGPHIDFTLDVKNTGNTHYFVYASGRLHGLSAKSDQPQTTSLLLPAKSRVVGSTIPAPLLPGVYEAVYGFKTDDGQIVERKQPLVYLPPWSLLLPIGIVWFMYTARRYRSRARR